eukprot:CAMPEP_0204324956 /NCGR_PEP_ID=MMETSP0469-20131031/10659_1 /ASSEMBLY_ACC=CAM_ASM_000384 /TAXON_ID=2969 /ORGANISM="Oxyrrhis marina" /LENGTH=47 /DNA_ID= /DNA_START= /DNA_END= /DNA_ORIENTATION=
MASAAAPTLLGSHESTQTGKATGLARCRARPMTTMGHSGKQAAAVDR